MKTTGRKKPESPAATLAQLKALCDPLRYRVFENLLAEARSPKQMAEHLGTHPTRLYHHFRVLEKAGLIRATGTQKKRGTVEKYFKAAVDRIEMPAAAGGAQTALLAGLMEGVLGATLADMQGGEKARGGPGQSYVKRYRIRTTPKLAAGIRAKIEELAALCERASASGGAIEVGVTMALSGWPDSGEGTKEHG